MTLNLHPDDACRYCQGTGKEKNVEFRNGYSVTIIEHCWWCRGTGNKTVVFGVAK